MTQDHDTMKKQTLLTNKHKQASAAVRQCTPGAELWPKLSDCSSGCTPGAELPPKLAGSAGVGLGGRPAAPALSAPGVQFLLHVAVHGPQSQGQRSFPPIALNHGRDIPHYESLLVWKCQRCQTQSLLGMHRHENSWPKPKPNTECGFCCCSFCFYFSPLHNSNN